MVDQRRGRQARGPAHRTGKEAPFGRECPISALIVRDGWNMRTQNIPPEAQIELGRSMQFGQVTPCLGVQYDEDWKRLPAGKIRLITGFQRYHSAKAVGLSTLWVLDPGIDQARDPRFEAWLLNRIENTRRVEVTTPERFRAYVDAWHSFCPDGKGQAAKIDQMVADRFGVSAMTVSRARRLHADLSPRIWTAWEHAPGAFSVELLTRWSQLDKPEQEMALAEKIAGANQEELEAEATPVHGELRETWGQGKISKARIKAALGELHRGGFHLRPKAWVEGAIALGEWVLGEAPLTNQGLGQQTLPLGLPAPKARTFDSVPTALKVAADAGELADVPEYPDTKAKQRTAEKALTRKSGQRRKAPAPPRAPRAAGPAKKA
jgi:hypothetical protein